MEQNKFKGFSSFSLKIIAIVCMIIDHYSYSLYLQSTSYSYETYTLMRCIGRISFPIYCFLLVEGFFYTSNIKKYIGRCLIFACLSEIPFDMAMFGKVYYPEYQNVFFTLALGLITLSLLEKIETIEKIRMYELYFKMVCVFIAAVAAEVMDFDYHFFGILAIVMFYLLRKRGVSAGIRFFVGAAVFFFAECIDHIKYFISVDKWMFVIAYCLIMPIAFIPVYLYNGKRGFKLKYLFYFVYPVHLLIFGLIRILGVN